MKDTDKFCAARRSILAWTIAIALSAPGASRAVDGPQTADGTTLALSPGDYVGDGKTVLSILNAGNMTADSGIVVTADGANAHGAQINGVGSMLSFHGGALSTTGQSGYGIYTLRGGKAEIGYDPIGVGTMITTSGLVAYGLFNSDPTSEITGSGVTVVTAGPASHAAVNNGGVLTLSDSSLFTSGDNSYGVTANGYANSNAAGSRTDLTHVDVTTQGAQAHAVYLDGQLGGGSKATIRGGTFSTSGDSAVGIYVIQGAQAVVADAGIQTSGKYAYGIVLDQAGSTIELEKNVAISTSGDNAEAVWAVGPNTKVDAAAFDVRTSGDKSTAFDNRAAVITLTNGSILTTGSNSHALYTSMEYGDDTHIDGNDLTIRTEGAGSVGAYARLGSHISLTDSNVETAGAEAYGLYAARGGLISLKDTNVMTTGSDAYAAVIDTGGGALNMTGGRLFSTQSGALAVAGNADIQLSHGVQVAGASGVLLDVYDPTVRISLAMDDKVSAQGDMVLNESLVESGTISAANATVSLSHGSQWLGATRDVIGDLSIDSDSEWYVWGSSSIGQLTLNNARIRFTPPVQDAYKTLAILGDFAGESGMIHMHALLNEGGPLSHQRTDRLLILGNVTTTNTTLLDIVAQGTGASAPIDNNGVVNPTDGISLVQVGGTSRADAFALRYGYVAVGPYQYKLYAFGPGQADASQNALPSGALNWDYRLAPKYIELPDEGHLDPDDGTSPPDPDPGLPDEPSTGGNGSLPEDANSERVQDLVAQLPSYIVAPTALLNYGDTIIDTLHQRLGEIRDTPPADPHGGELLVRYIGSQQRYASDQGTYGYDFNQQINAVQLGGSLVSLTSDASSLRIGWALDKGVTRVTPRVYDSEDASFSRYDAHGVSAWMTWQQSNGFYVDAVLGGERYQGSVSTAIRGSDVAQIRAGGWTASVETGYPFALGGGWWIEPQLQVKRQSLSFDPFQDADNLATQIRVAGSTRARAGIRVSKTDNLRFSPYVRVDFTNTRGGGSTATVSSEAWDVSGSFRSGRLGNTVRAGAGASSQFLPYLSLYGEADYLHATTDYGMRGWEVNLALRFEF
ncbi:autotransporter outer membrane beta-barrel domain-containing protein [Dyella flava]|uniref:Autotransporter outer membrane beta-barrel domain-containing protein n=1 Tax=Dyella flava TaxID=1920170 RepID=A0ABS2K330_9GAMM|nr:autotransporter outer membrane beta-barrel domain-containing protein [Dyella flava]MBM7125544.1 autotransporter outer membrane beta-barrel domain-containing protein [Dyella flava]GLQ51594.1 hypothetical protein GCM10010872_30430 [Dyella flava]